MILFGLLTLSGGPTRPTPARSCHADAYTQFEPRSIKASISYYAAVNQIKRKVNFCC